MKNLPKPRVYVAGPYSCQRRCRGLGVSLKAMREGIQASRKVIYEGMIPFCPWFDFMWALLDEEGILSKEWFYEYTSSFLVVCDVVYIHKIEKGSEGTLNEMLLAEKNGIPVVNSFKRLLSWRDKWIQRQQKV